MKPAVVTTAHKPATVAEAIAARDLADSSWLRFADAAAAVKASGDELAQAGFADFREFCESAHGLRMSKSHVENQIRAADELRLKLSDSEISSIGIKRALAIAPLIKNGGNAAELLTMARTLPAPDFDREIAKLKGDPEGGGEFTRVSFSIPNESAEVIQSAITRAKRAGETDSDGRALELICADYLAGSH